MAKTKVINCYRDKDPKSIYIGRPTMFGNPYEIGKHGSREYVIAKYRKWLFDKICSDPEFRLTLMQLDGRKLACFCKPQACHGDVIVKAIEWLKSLKEISPLTDGINHINVYSKGNTLLGRLLSNFAHTPFSLVGHGEFASVEGYWYWLSTGDDKLRELHGVEAKMYGRKVRGKDWPKDDEFKWNVLHAIKEKILQHQSIQELLKGNTLPLKHYYVQQGAVVYPSEGCQWILDHIEEIKRGLNE